MYNLMRYNVHCIDYYKLNYYCSQKSKEYLSYDNNLHSLLIHSSNNTIIFNINYFKDLKNNNYSASYLQIYLQKSDCGFQDSF